MALALARGGDRLGTQTWGARSLEKPEKEPSGTVSLTRVVQGRDVLRGASCFPRRRRWPAAGCRCPLGEPVPAPPGSPWAGCEDQQVLPPPHPCPTLGEHSRPLGGERRPRSGRRQIAGQPHPEARDWPWQPSGPSFPTFNDEKQPGEMGTTGWTRTRQRECLLAPQRAPRGGVHRRVCLPLCSACTGREARVVLPNA